MGDVLATDEDGLLRVSASTPPQDLASAIAHACYEGAPPLLRAIGAGAVNQAVKAIAIANGYVGPRGMSLTTRIGFATLNMPDMPGKQISAMVFRVVVDR